MQETIQATKLHCKLCFDTLIAALSKQKKPDFPKQLKDVSVPLFVTWKLDGDLRGCIGTFQPNYLSKILSQYALTAAFNDNRFAPINNKQLERLSVGLSLLVNFQEGKQAYDWEIGKHGIIIDLLYGGRNYSATYLPEVAAEQKWNHEETISSLLKKAGYFKEYNEQVRSKIKVTTYESSKANLSYQEYKKM